MQADEIVKYYIDMFYKAFFHPAKKYFLFYKLPASPYAIMGYHLKGKEGTETYHLTLKTKN